MSNETLNKSINYFSKIFSVDTNKSESLAEFVKRIRTEKDISTLDVEAESRKGGLKGISNGYVSQIENNYIQNVSPDKLKALAKGLGVPEEKLFAIARGTETAKILMIDELEMYLNELPISRQQDVLEITKLFHLQEKANKVPAKSFGELAPHSKRKIPMKKENKTKQKEVA